MSKRSRDAAMDRATSLGAAARRRGLPQSANPYTRGGPWSLYPAWSVGWEQEDARLKRYGAPHNTGPTKGN